LGPWNNKIKTTTETSFNDEGLVQLTPYYYRVLSYDGIPNRSALSVLGPNSSATTYSSAVPDVPSAINVTTTKGNPNTDTNVGHTATITFTGSHSADFQITKYEIYRSTSNNVAPCNQGERNTECWIRLNSATKLSDVNVNPPTSDDRVPHTVTDSGLLDATTYYYKVRAQDNTLVPAIRNNLTFIPALPLLLLVIFMQVGILLRMRLLQPYQQVLR
jgi:hypothetical protein